MSLKVPFRYWLTGFALLVSLAVTKAQTNAAAVETALRFLRENPAQFNLSMSDVGEVRVSDTYISKHNGLTHVWLQQQHAGIPVFNALFGLHVGSDGKVYHLGHRFEQNLHERINTTLPSLSATKALELAMAELGFSGFQTPSLQRKISDREFVFEGGSVSKSPITVSACYQPVKNGGVRLAWQLVIDQANTPDMWSMRLDAQSGKLLHKNNRTNYCKVGHVHFEGEACPDEADQQAVPSVSSAPQYRVFPLPAESPAHGVQSVVTDPAFPGASPYGWHDVNGAAGAEYTYTRGNNVWAYDDSANDNTADPSESVDGGTELHFDFPYNGNAEPDVNRPAAITNLFYMNNMMHDISYRFGFDEQAGNFQVNNYGNGGAAGDAVRAEGLDGGGSDNANMATPPDGSQPRMQMYLWSRRGGNIVRVNAPGAVLGSYEGAPASGWGAPITTTPVTAEAVVVNDGSPEPSLGCNPLSGLAGKIAIIDRGVCNFSVKALNAQQAGAIGCIICNFENSTIAMGAGAVGAQVTIPTLMMKSNDCELLKQYAGAGLNISLVLPAVSGPEFLDGDFDNGIIAHEYTHGISNRLTGGPSQADCLGNAEQMGEGWSDWFSLITSVRPSDVAATRRGIGTFVLRQPNDGIGIRRYPYSTDLNTSPVTYSTVAQNTGVHAIGEVWAAVTWDLYWAMVEKYGYDPDWTNLNSGNSRAIQLIMDGMKLQPCSPGFMDGRDAILLANQVNYNSADTCLIIDVFARRGMGLFSSQSDGDNATDGIENFDPIPTCVKELKIKKITNTPTLDPGEEAEFLITVTNHKDEPVTGVVVSDELPVGMTLASASNGGTANGNLVTWNLGALQSGQIVTLSYRAKTDPNVGSIRYFRDEMEDEVDWFPFFTEGSSAFYLQSNTVKTGQSAWRADNSDTETDMQLEYFGEINVTGARPTLRFWHQFNTEPSADAGFVEIRKSSEQQWQRFPKTKMIRSPYTGPVQYGTFAIPFLNGFSGNSNGWVQSYIDLSDYAGQSVTVRYRFGSDTNTGGDGWVVDDTELVDLFNYDGEVCVTSDQGDQICTRAPEFGVIMNPSTIISTKDPAANAFALTVQPNPSSDLLFVMPGESLEGETRILLIGMDGRIALQRTTQYLSAGQSVALDVQDLPAGMYSLRVENGKGVRTVKVVVK